MFSFIINKLLIMFPCTVDTIVDYCVACIINIFVAKPEFEPMSFVNQIQFVIRITVTFNFYFFFYFFKPLKYFYSNEQLINDILWIQVFFFFKTQIILPIVDSGRINEPLNSFMIETLCLVRLVRFEAEYMSQIFAF